MCKCAFKYCLYVSPDIKPEDDVEKGGKHYHKKCLDVSETIKEILDVYYNDVSKTVIMKNLRHTINIIVFTKHVDCHFLLFALKQAIAQKRQIKAPAYLYYLIDDYDLKKKWETEQGRKIIREAKEQSQADDVSAPSFKTGSDKPVGFDAIFGG